jgi:hypothetical protein
MVALLAVLFLLGQTPVARNVPVLIKQLQDGPFMRVTVNELAAAGALEALPVLRERFKTMTAQPSAAPFPSKELEHLTDKAVVASALVRLGDKSPQYWDFLEAYATVAVNDDAPFPLRFDAAGRMIPKDLAPEFLTWTAARKVDPTAASWDQVYGMPGRLLMVVQSHDPRGLPLLRKALTSRNHYVQAQGARGLAILKDQQSIPQIIDACLKAPADIAPVLARALIFFDDPEAQRIVEQFIPDKAMLDELRKLGPAMGV